MKIGPRPPVRDAVYSIFIAKEPFVYRVIPSTCLKEDLRLTQAIYTLLTVSGLTD